MCSAQVDNNSRKLRLRCSCQLGGQLIWIWTGLQAIDTEANIRDSHVLQKKKKKNRRILLTNCPCRCAFKSFPIHQDMSPQVSANITHSQVTDNETTTTQLLGAELATGRLRRKDNWNRTEYKSPLLMLSDRTQQSANAATGRGRSRSQWLRCLRQCFSTAGPRPVTGPSSYRKKNLPDRGLTKVENHRSKA
jgi:hypothetical protein